ncbi:MAG: MarR family transcriptional regulator [Pseudomonadota bacterium]
MSTKNRSLHDPELALLVDRFMRRIHFGLQSRAHEFDRKSVGPGGGVILMTLADMGCTPLNELTNRVARDKSQMTRTMHSLEKKGLVKREPSPTDGRVSMVSLTLEGNKVVKELMATVADVIGDILEPISDAEKQTLKNLLQRIHR